MNLPFGTNLYSITPRISAKIISVILSFCITFLVFSIYTFKSEIPTPQPSPPDNSQNEPPKNEPSNTPNSARATLNESGATPISGLITAKCGLIYETGSKKVIAQKSDRSNIEIGDTSVFTVAILVVKAVQNGEISWEEEAVCPASAAKRYNYHASSNILTIGKKMSVSELLRCMIYQGGSAYAYTLAVHISGSEEAFVIRMNNLVKELGLNDTVFTNVCGEDDSSSKTTAYDTASIIDEFLKLPILKEMFVSTGPVTVYKSENSNSVSLSVYNDFFSKHTTISQSKADGITGGKIGFSGASQWSVLIFYVNQTEYAVVTMGTTVPYSDALQLFVSYS